ncbi:tyrosine-type recombinase/integrase [Ideonella sp. B508-1]|uniref:tyrosine-type recombinase/integrase n=1 Tax=Ideonella sp. B508-1 TaxID=137716 RepID=UPI0003B31383|nr:tyrosine-type recombinase/integrase [Ideonella sp. B508-1]
MARPKNAPPDLSERVNLVPGVIERLTCPEGKQQAFLRDRDVPRLRVRVTAAGAKSFVFEAKLNKQTIRRTIGDVRAWTIEAARAEARRLAVMLDGGTDPRELERQQAAARAAEQAAEVARAAAEQKAAMPAREVWEVYLQERRPHWGELHYLSHLEKASLGGVPSKRRGMTDTLTKPGPLAALLALPLRELNSERIEAWAADEGKLRPSSARLAWRQLTVFLNWCAEQQRFADLLPDRNPAKTKRARESLGRPGVKDDVLTKEQLAAWFAAVRGIQNPVISAALQVMLLTGARPGEVLALEWADVNWQWKGLTIRDKVEGERTIPLTPYVAALLEQLPRRNAYVFSSTRTLAMDDHNRQRRARKAAARGTAAPSGDVLETSASGQIAPPNTPHTRACKVAGIDGLTLHGLRRSFSSLTEWMEIPAGVVAQIQGHKPSATAEKHYKRRPLDLLRVHHERIEAWMLEQAGVAFTPAAGAAKLHAVK